MTPLDTSVVRAPGRGGGYIVTNLETWVRALVRAPQSRRAIPPLARHAKFLGVAAIAIVLSMIFLDQAAIGWAAKLPVWVNRAFNEFTDLALAGKFLVPLGILILLIAVLDAPWLARPARLVMAALVARLGFLFLAITLPGIVGNILKHQIGRRRPSELGPFTYDPFSWQHAFSSFPSGHATTAFAVMVAFGALFPRLRALLWIYAILIAISRVVISTHYPSDVMAGALVGGFGALLVRNWFAERRLCFYVGSDREVRLLPGPSLRRLWRAVRALAVS
jgi:membrane-associated phospholipid phosphatase